MAFSLTRLSLRAVFINLERNVAVLSCSQNQLKQTHRRSVCSGSMCYLKDYRSGGDNKELDLTVGAISRRYSKRHGAPGEERRRDSDSGTDSDSETECKGYDRSDFWRRKMRTVHNILDVDKDGLVSYSDFLLLSQRFKDLGHLDDRQAEEFSAIIKLTWEEQWGAVDPYNYVTVEQYLEDMHHVLNDRALKDRAVRWLPYLFKAVDKDRSGWISVQEFRLFYRCLGLGPERAAVAFAAIDTNADGKLTLKEFVKLGREFFFTEDETRVSRMFWGPLIED